MHLSQYVITAYMMMIGLFEPMTAYLADTLGTKRIYILSLVVFTAGSVLCAIAWNIQSLIVFRIIQATGGGMIMPLALSIVEKTFSKKELPLAMGLMGIPLLVAPAMGPTIGGYFVEYINWRWIFWINIPIGITAVFASVLLLQEFTTMSKKLDLFGFIFSAIGFAALLLAVSNGPTDGWHSLSILSLFILSGICLLTFVFVEARHPVPLLDLRIFKNRVYTASLWITFFMMIGLFGSLFLVPLFMQQLRGLGAMETGIILIPEVIGAAVLIPISALLLPLVGARILTIIGIAIMTAGAFPLTQIQIDTSISSIESDLVIVGAGIGFAMMPAITMAYTVLPEHLVNQGSAFINMTRQIGSSLGVAILTSVIQERVPVHFAHLAESVTPWSTTGQMLQVLIQRFQSAGYELQQAHQMSLSVIYQQVQLMSNVLAFHDAFLVSALLGLSGIIPALFLFDRNSEKEQSISISEDVFI
ncbi:MFS transporter [Alicyclobacillus contaminans]|uniref:DHA2 family efflux MFS transporter permease subunit n=1 Tax=Alicyclobacillus contaminans TaxID=392016 RepID=UPI000403FBB8|nr:DHA2 family efflux MFS transporter permease subunit [Alicyclobacillus contaminans]GMA50815.1 MFS transporter [Alicyclobacillus contaminans]